MDNRYHPFAEWYGKPITAFIATGHMPVEPIPYSRFVIPREPVEGEREFAFRYNPYDVRYPENKPGDVPDPYDDDQEQKLDLFFVTTRKEGNAGTLDDYIIRSYSGPTVIYYSEQ